MCNEQIQYPRLDQVATASQVREHFDEESIYGLAMSLKEVGQLQPIRVRKVGDKFVIVDGERRFRAAKKAGFTTIAAIIEEKDMTGGEVVQRQMIANCQREDLTPLEKSKAVAGLMEETGWNASQVAAKLGLSNATVTRLLALLTLPAEVQKRVASGEIAASAAYELARVEDAGEQAKLANQLASGRLTRDGLTGAMKASRNEKPPAGGTQAARATAVLGPGRSVTVACADLTLERFIELIEELLAKARKVRPQGVELSTFVKMLRDQSRTA
jgi:ParB family chromosome partitioning protein